MCCILTVLKSYHTCHIWNIKLNWFPQEKGRNCIYLISQAICKSNLRCHSNPFYLTDCITMMQLMAGKSGQSLAMSSLNPPTIQFNNFAYFFSFSDFVTSLFEITFTFLYFLAKNPLGKYSFIKHNTNFGLVLNPSLTCFDSTQQHTHTKYKHK